MNKATNVIEAENLTKKLENLPAVNKITFNVHKGEIFRFVGYNGAGKTTAIRMLIGLLIPTSEPQALPDLMSISKLKKSKKTLDI